MASAQITEATLKRVAQNARLHLSAEELRKMVPQFQEMLDVFKRIDEVDVTNTAPSFHPVRLQSRLRLDVPSRCLLPQEALSNAVHQKPPYFKGPKAME